jgi:hypothetical protein
VNLYRVTLKHECPYKDNKTLYVVEKTKESASRVANDKSKRHYSVKSIAYLGESLTFGNTLFCK